MIVRASRISAYRQRILFKSFCLDQTAEIAATMAKVNKNTANLWFRHWREKIYEHLRRAPRFFGEVEMDQKSFGGRGRKRMQAHLKQLAKRLPHSEYMKRAREIRSEHKVQVLGILQRGGDVYVHVIKKADKATLMPIMRLVVQRGTIAYTDKWRAFNDLGIDGYKHKSVNHSVEYMDKAGNHSNGIEAFWSFCTRRLSKFNGIPVHTYPLHLKECEFRYNNKDFATALKKLLG